jgi:secreted PhoX family phosphatase
MKMVRRSFLVGMGAFASSTAVLTLTRRAHGDAGFGDLEADPAGILDLPFGFSYVLLQTKGDIMSDGIAVGALPDGMCCLEDNNGNYVLLRNHEERYGVNPAPDFAWDATAIGGVSRVVVDRNTLAVLSSNLVLTGTVRNCAGGQMPDGWVTCEETADDGHGYAFFCSADAVSVEAPQQIPTFGRFEHEATAYDKGTGITYLTEDVDDSVVYRHVPDDTSNPFVGKLQGLKIVGVDNWNSSDVGIAVGDTFDVEWVDVADPEGTTEEVRYQAQALGAAIFVRGEGAWFAKNSIWFTCTEGGPTGQGQVWRLDVSASGDTLTLVAQAEGEGEMKSPDNIAATPWGDVIVCEDGDAPNYLRGITPEGIVYTFAKNAVEDGSSEFAGACFSPDGQVMFVNIQAPGYTLAIKGPWPKAPDVDCGCV